MGKYYAAYCIFILTMNLMLLYCLTLGAFFLKYHAFSLAFSDIREGVVISFVNMTPRAARKHAADLTRTVRGDLCS